MSKCILAQFLVLFFIHETVTKSFTPCEFAVELHKNYNFSLDQTKILLCIAQKLSGLNTNVIGGSLHGIFQINRAFCSEGTRKGEFCHTECDSLTDDDINDDVICVKKILSERGLSPWRFDKKNACRKIISNFEKRCIEPKINRCEYAKKLLSLHNDLSQRDALSWACISEHDEVRLKTGNVNQTSNIESSLNDKNFQHWPSYEKCSDIKPEDIIRCFRSVDLVFSNNKKFTTSTEISIVYDDDPIVESSTSRPTITSTLKSKDILKEQTDEGYSWIRVMKNEESTTTETLIEENVLQVISKYFPKSTTTTPKKEINQIKSTTDTLKDEDLPESSKVSRENQDDLMKSTTNQMEEGNLENSTRVSTRDEDLINSIMNSLESEDSLQTTTHSHEEDEFEQGISSEIPEDDYEISHRYDHIDKCLLAENMRDYGGIDHSLIPKFVCIAQHESQLNISLITQQENGSHKYGLFQIDDQNYCNTNEMINENCDVLCAHLNDDQFNNDLECLYKIYKREGFSYWPSEKYCSSVDENYLSSCFSKPTTTTHRPFTIWNRFQLTTTTPSMAQPSSTEEPTTDVSISDDKFCKFVKFLHENQIEIDQLAIYACIADKSNKSENFIGTFGIKKVHCDDGICDLNCTNLVDNDFVDDLECSKKVYKNFGLSEWNLNDDECLLTYNSKILQCIEDEKLDIRDNDESEDGIAEEMTTKISDKIGDDFNVNLRSDESTTREYDLDLYYTSIYEIFTTLSSDVDERK